MNDSLREVSLIPTGDQLTCLSSSLFHVPAQRGRLPSSIEVRGKKYGEREGEKA